MPITKILLKNKSANSSEKRILIFTTLC